MSNAATDLPPHDHTIEPGEINRRGCRRCQIEDERSAAQDRRNRRSFYATSVYPYPSPFAAEPRPSERELKQLRKLMDEAKQALGEWAYRATTRPRIW